MPVVLLDNSRPGAAPAPAGGEVPGYSLAQFEADIAKIKPRAFDIYFLGPLMIYFAMQAKKPLGKWPRRVLFTAGVYTIYRNWQAYKALPRTVKNLSLLQES